MDYKLDVRQFVIFFSSSHVFRYCNFCDLELFGIYVLVALNSKLLYLQVGKNIFLLKSLDELFQKGREAVDYPTLQDLMQKVCVP